MARAARWRRRFRLSCLKLKRWRRRVTPAIVWDGFMVYLALVNVGVILFDFTYLWSRPVYFKYLPVVVEVYDPVKGIEPHPLTARLLEAADALEAELVKPRADEHGEKVDELLAELRDLSHQIVATDPFGRSGQSRNLLRIEAHTRRYLESLGEEPPLAVGEAIDGLWSSESRQLAGHLAFFNRELRPLFAVNYHREYDLDGQLVDYGWLLDLPFLLIFATEFLVRWFLALRDRRYPKWFLFPLFNWYDLLGIVPLPQFRIFRLFRIASIYVRLARSEKSTVGDDVVSRTVAYFANIISEEISDMVALRILGETQAEIRDGTHKRIIRAVIAPRREALARELTLRVRDALASSEVRLQARAFLDANLARAVDHSGALGHLPLPKAVVRSLVEIVGTLVFDAFAETLAATLESDDGQQALYELLLGAVDGLVEELTEGEVEELAREISLDSLEHVKDAVAVRKWIDTEAPIRAPARLWAQTRTQPLDE